MFAPDNNACGTGLVRGLGDWILVMACAWASVGASSSDESDDDDSELSEDESSFLSRNSKTLGAFFAGSAGLSGEGSEAACGFRGCLRPFSFSVGLEPSTEPVCVSCVELETVDNVLFLPSFFDFLAYSGMVIGEGRRHDPAHCIKRRKIFRVLFRPCSKAYNATRIE